MTCVLCRLDYNEKTWKREQCLFSRVHLNSSHIRWVTNKIHKDANKGHTKMSKMSFFSRICSFESSGFWVGLIWLLAVDLHMPDLSNTPKVWNDLAAVRRDAKRFEEYHYSLENSGQMSSTLLVFWCLGKSRLVCCACACVHAFTICIYIWNPRFWGDGLDFLSIYIYLSIDLSIYSNLISIYSNLI